MTSERRPAPQALTYEIWKVQLRKECENEGKMLAFDSLGEYTLKLLWQNGLDPNVWAIVESIDGQANLSPTPETDSQAP